MPPNAPASAPVTTERGAVVFIGYDTEGQPTGVVTRRDGKLVEWFLKASEGDGATYLEGDEEEREDNGRVQLGMYSNPVPTRAVWYADDITVLYWHQTPKEGGGFDYVERPAEGPDDLARMGWHRVAEPLGPDPFEDTEEVSEGSLDYCAVCDDYTHGERDGRCLHTFWVDGVGMCGPGCDDQVGRASVPDGFKLVVRRTGCARHLLAELSALAFPSVAVSSPMIGRSSAHVEIGGRDFSDAFEALHDLADGRRGADVRIGAGWVRALDEKTTEANAVVVAWLREEVAAQDARRASGEAAYAVDAGEYTRKRHAARVPFAAAALKARELRASGAECVRIVRLIPKPAAAPQGGR